MASLNKVQLIGNLGNDPDTRYLPDGTAVCNFSLACNETWKDKAGNKQERVEWIRCSAFGKLAEICGEYLKKGKQIYVEGRMRTRKWQDKNGADRYTTEVNIDSMLMLGQLQRGGQESGSEDTQRSYDPATRTGTTRGTGTVPAGDFEDDIPF